ncbi:hypothetical protein DIPPA_00137 [Diplonema papillatum]|nr:hypothetical protein DIPPA_00137 [Diplonema papillatum]
MSIDFAALLREELAQHVQGSEKVVVDTSNSSLPPKVGSMRDVNTEEVRFPSDWRVSCKVEGAVECVWLIENALSEGCERVIVDDLRQSQCESGPVSSKVCDEVSSSGRWVSLKDRRVLKWDREPQFSGWASQLAACFSRDLSTWQGSACNHILVNWYDADGGILPHTDGPAYLAATATVSLSEPAIMRFSPRLGFEGKTFDLLLRPRAVVVFSHEAYSTHTHEILPGSAITISESCLNRPDAAEDLARLHEHRRVQNRASLTFRHCLPEPARV